MVKKSDYESNFRGVQKTKLSGCCRIGIKLRYMDRFSEKGIHWHFSAPSSSHTGDVWERTIKTIRKNMRALSDDETPRPECVKSRKLSTIVFLHSNVMILAICQLWRLTLYSWVIETKQFSKHCIVNQPPRESCKQAQKLAHEFWADV